MTSTDWTEQLFKASQDLKPTPIRPWQKPQAHDAKSTGGMPWTAAQEGLEHAHSFEIFSMVASG